MKQRTASFFYYKSHTFSGQSKASEILIEQLGKLDWNCEVINIFGLDHTKTVPFRSALLLLPGLIWTIIQAAKIASRKSPLVHMNLGQGMGAFVRYGAPLLVLRMLNGSCNIAVSLHGNLFMSWKDDELNTRILVRLLKTANLVTVLGEKQRNKLISLGIAREDCQVLPNPCEVTPIPLESLRQKHGDSEEIVVLHLSSLMKSKGYLDFLLSAQEIARLVPNQKLKFVVCGPIVREAGEPKSINFLTTELNETLAQLNGLDSQVSAEWIPGISGKDKESLLYGAHLFVFPTRYNVEAQPLVLLEAMAAGACIVTTDIGEIPEALSGAQAILLNEPNTDQIARATAELILNSHERVSAAANNRLLVFKTYSTSSYGEFWSDYFGANVI